MKIDEETREVLAESEELAIGVKGRFWGIVKRRFITKITALNDIMNLDLSAPDLVQRVMADQRVVAILIEMIREIEGEARTSKDYQETFNKVKIEEYIELIEG